MSDRSSQSLTHTICTHTHTHTPCRPGHPAKHWEITWFPPENKTFDWPSSFSVLSAGLLWGDRVKRCLCSNLAQTHWSSLIKGSHSLCLSLCLSYTHTHTHTHIHTAVLAWTQALHLLGRCSTTVATPQVILFLVCFFQIGFHTFAWTGLKLPSSYLHFPSSLDCRGEAPRPTVWSSSLSLNFPIWKMKHLQSVFSENTHPKFSKLRLYQGL
jgi:hypothetical protein